MKNRWPFIDGYNTQIYTQVTCCLHTNKPYIRFANMDAMLFNLTSTINYLKTHDYVFPKKLSTPSRVTGFLLCPFACSCCICWSTTWRFIACPFQCITKGCAFACSDNGCTEVTDKCIGECVKQLNETTGPSWNCWLAELKAANPSQLASMLQCLNELEAMFAGSSIKIPVSNRYNIAERIIDPLLSTFGYIGKTCTPYMAVSAIDQMRKDLEKIRTEEIPQGQAQAVAESTEIIYVKAKAKSNRIMPNIA